MERETKDKSSGAFPEQPAVTAEQAVALSYDRAAGGLPRVTAKGQGRLAAELVRLALEHNIPVKYDPDLVQVLAKLDVGDDIPEEVYLVVAEVLAFIYWVNQEFSWRTGADRPPG
ncbi:MAG: EscU/YscU/HrcU family type III secretion system export apparatus switch protein [Thermodesulfobacteriota bacterium]